MEALEQFLKENQDFRIDPSREKLMFTFNPRGYLRRL
jgi:cephalosporin hydroxylase